LSCEGSGYRDIKGDLEKSSIAVGHGALETIGPSAGLAARLYPTYPTAPQQFGRKEALSLKTMRGRKIFCPE